MSYEHCCECDVLTGRAGRHDDSLYYGGTGPFCEDCYSNLPVEWLDELATNRQRIAELEEAQRWRAYPDEKPENGEGVLCRYGGVYDFRIATFWMDAGGNGHFGKPSEADGKGSQPATHWMPLPKPPGAE